MTISDSHFNTILPECEHKCFNAKKKQINPSKINNVQESNPILK